MTTETYREENELNEVQHKLEEQSSRDQYCEDQITSLQEILEKEKEDKRINDIDWEHERNMEIEADMEDREEEYESVGDTDEKSEYEDDEMIYN